MRIDDDNKVVWCSESEIDWYVSFNAPVGNSTFSDLRRINALSTEKEVLLPSYMTVADRVELIRAISDNYEFKLGQLQKYYWRKKEEYIFNFEKVYEAYLNKELSDNDIFISDVEEGCSAYKTKFTETEARDLLKDDFDKFEKVECE